MKSVKLALYPVAKEVLATLGKAVVALTVFAAVIYAFQVSSAKQAKAIVESMPLPNLAIQSDCAVWFVGSSSVSRWSTLQRDMAPWVTHNRSIGGASLAEIAKRFSNEQDSQAPQAIVFYAGENDLAFGVPVSTVAERFAAFLRSKEKQVGHVPVLFVSVKPSPVRWEQRGVQAQLNKAVRRLADQRSDLSYVETVPELLENGRPGPFFDPDGLHLNEAGYQIFAAQIGNALRRELPASVVRRCAPIGTPH